MMLTVLGSESELFAIVIVLPSCCLLMHVLAANEAGIASKT